MEVHLKGSNGKYISSENGEQAMRCNRGIPLEWERFVIEDVGEGKVALKSRGKYVSSGNGQEPMKCNVDWIRGWEKFEIIHHPNGTCSFKGNNGKYVSSENGCGKGITCNRDGMGYWEYFLIEKVEKTCPCSDDVQKLQAQVATLTEALQKSSKANEELAGELLEGLNGSSKAIAELKDGIGELREELDGAKQENLELRKNLEKGYRYVF